MASPYETAGALSSLIGALAATALWLFFLFGWQRGISGRATLIAASGTLAWLLVLYSAYTFASSAQLLGRLAGLLELVAYALWFGVLLRALDITSRHRKLDAEGTKCLLLWATLIVAGGGLLTSVAVSLAARGVNGAYASWIADLARLVVGVHGLVLLEQVVRNTRRHFHWNLKYLVLGLGIVFGYAFILHADAVLFQRKSPALMAAHGAVIALAVPFLVIATTRNRNQRLSVNLSHRVVFRSGALLVTGSYLLLISAGGFWLRQFGGEWGDVLATLFLAAAAVLGIVLAASHTLREHFTLALASNLFEQKHDYREVWLRITDALTASEDDTPLPQRSISVLGEIVHAHGGGVWRLDASRGLLFPVAQLRTQWTVPLTPDVSESLRAHFEADATPVHLSEEAAQSSNGIDSVATPLRTRIRDALPEAYIVVPLLLQGQRLYGVMVLTRPETGEQLTWEEDELLAVAGRQVASFLAQQEGQEALALGSQLAAFNRVTAFVVHDLKTIVSQLSLLSRNAARHRDNPEFVDDMAETIDHAVERMQSLLLHLHQQREERPREPRDVSVDDLFQRIAERQAQQTPGVSFDTPDPALNVRGEPDKLAAALAHLVQNAQEATPESGLVRLDAKREDDWTVIRITDTGEGMTADFVETQLFKPFESTKGLAGMGIGTWQAREHVRSLGGDVQVHSVPSRGTVFTVRIPATSTASSLGGETAGAGRQKVESSISVLKETRGAGGRQA